MPTTTQTLQQTCITRGLTLAVAESCTGGLLAHRITNIPGSSSYFLGGTVTYQNSAKRQLLRVPRGSLQRHGAVSESVARAMARGVRTLFGATIGVAITGIAGPTGGTTRKPVGTVYIAIAGSLGTRVRRHRFRGTRIQIKRHAADAALRHVRQYIQRR